jgi:hypothetical protein
MGGSAKPLRWRSAGESQIHAPSSESLHIFITRYMVFIGNIYALRRKVLY